MCALLRWWRRLWASFGGGTGVERKPTHFGPVREKKVWKELPALWSNITTIQTRVQLWHEPINSPGWNDFPWRVFLSREPLNSQDSPAGKKKRLYVHRKVTPRDCDGVLLHFLRGVIAACNEAKMAFCRPTGLLMVVFLSSHGQEVVR